MIRIGRRTILAMLLIVVLAILWNFAASIKHNPPA
jgi:hypothetical protein